MVLSYLQVGISESGRDEFLALCLILNVPIQTKYSAIPLFILNPKAIGYLRKKLF